MKPADIHIVNISVGTTLYGLWTETSDRMIGKDIPVLSKRFYAILGAKPTEVLPFYVLSKAYDPQSKTMQLFIGGEAAAEGLTACQLPAGRYGKTVIKPFLGFLWGPAIGSKKRYLYTRWLPEHGYIPKNLDFEKHTQKSIGRGAEIDFYFGLVQGSASEEVW